MQCLLPDVTFDINGHEYTHEQAYFASVDEFTKAWSHHRRARKDGMVRTVCVRWRSREGESEVFFGKAWSHVTET